MSSTKGEVHLRAHARLSESPVYYFGTKVEIAVTGGFA